MDRVRNQLREGNVDGYKLACKYSVYCLHLNAIRVQVECALFVVIFCAE